MEMQLERVLCAGPPPLTLPLVQPVPPPLVQPVPPPAPPPSPTGTGTRPRRLPEEPRALPPSPPSPTGPQQFPASPLVPPTSPTSPRVLLMPPPQAPGTLPTQPKVKEHNKIFPWTPTLGIPLTLLLPSNLHQKLQQFWEKQKLDIKSMSSFKNHELPISRVKRIIKSEDPLRRVAGDVPALVCKACEIFVSELTLRGWFNVEEANRRTLGWYDIAQGTYYTDTYDFLVDVLTWDRGLIVKELAKRPGRYNGNVGTKNTNEGRSADIVGGISGVRGTGASFPNPGTWQRIPGMMGSINAGMEIGSGNLCADVGSSDLNGRNNYYMPVAAPNLFVLTERGEASSSQAPDIPLPVYTPNGDSLYQPNLEVGDDEPKN